MYNELVQDKIVNAISASATSITMTDASMITANPPFYATLAPKDVLPNRLNSEIVKVTAISGNNLTIQRGQRSTTAKAFEKDDIFVVGVYGDYKDLCPFPVNAIYISTTSTNPSEIWVGTTWERFGQGRTLVGVNESDTDFNTPSKHGGSKTVSSTHKHTTNGHILTVDEIPSHKHSMYCHNFSATGLIFTSGDSRGILIDSQDIYRYDDEILPTGGGASHSHGDTGDKTITTNVVQPYITTYFWKRRF